MSYEEVKEVLQDAQDLFRRFKNMERCGIAEDENFTKAELKQRGYSIFVGKGRRAKMTPTLKGAQLDALAKALVDKSPNVDPLNSLLASAHGWDFLYQMISEGRTLSDDDLRQPEFLKNYTENLNYFRKLYNV